MTRSRNLLLVFHFEKFVHCTDIVPCFIQSGRTTPAPLIIDCANGVGGPAAVKLSEYLGGTLPIVVENASTTTPGALNNACGADYVKTTQKLPPSLTARLQPGQRGCSLDGDADRLMYFYLDDRGQFRMLDGDKIAALVAAFIVELVKAAGLDDSIKVGVVQTAYANGASTKYLAEVSNMSSFHSPEFYFSLAPSSEMCANRCQTSPSCC